MVNLKWLPLVLILAACTPNTRAALDAVDAVVEKQVDITIARGVKRACKGPIDVLMRAAETYPALLAFVFASCPESYGRLRAAVLADVANREAITEAVRRALASQ